MPEDPAGRRSNPITLWVALVLVLISLLTYATDPAAPGSRRFPLGWWGWWDQSHYLQSAAALAHGVLAPEQHWYPLGYALLGAPFVWLWPAHAYLLPDLACLLLSYAAFLAFAEAVSVGGGIAACLFLLATFGHEALRHAWVEPWNTTLSGALIWSLLALTAGWPTGERAGWRRALPMAGMGWLAISIPFCRPTDGLLVAIWALGAGGWSIRHRLLHQRDLVALAVGASLALLPDALLWLRIYGPHASPYMLASRALGFQFGTLWWKTDMLLLSPRPWFPMGAGLMHPLPWIVSGLAGIVALPWITRGRPQALLGLLALMIVVYVTLFFAYVDLLPSGLWRFRNIHYFKWTLPGLALLGFVLLRALVQGPRRPASFALAGVLLLSGIRLLPHRVPDDAPAATPVWMVQLPDTPPDLENSYFAHPALRDSLGPLVSIIDYRAMPDSQGWRLIALRRPFVGRLVGDDRDPWGGALQRPQIRWRMTWGVGLPCWIFPCGRLPPGS